MSAHLASAIKSITLLDGTKIPQLAIGTGTALFGKDAAQPVLDSLASNILHIDTAQAYRNEEHVGNGLASFLSTSGIPREHLYITTKLNTLAAGETPVQSIKTSLAKLKLEYVDLFLIHFPTAFQDPGRLEEVWKGFEEIKDKGLAKSIGVSNFRPKDLERVLKIAKHKPVVNQIEFHPYVYKQLQPLLDLQKKEGIVTESFGGFTPLFRHKDGPVTGVLASIAKRIGSGATEGQILLKWLEAKEVVAVTTTSKKERLKEYIAAYELPALTTADVEAIDAAGAKVHSRHFAKHMDEL